MDANKSGKTMTVQSPCINVCVMDDDFEPEICAGCYRTAEEITIWSAADDKLKLEILEKCEQRRKDNQSIVFK
jgi:predicted Fe-S protein YdhL (DUF1289 family)